MIPVNVACDTGLQSLLFLFNPQIRNPPILCKGIAVQGLMDDKAYGLELEAHIGVSRVFPERILPTPGIQKLGLVINGTG